ncbi:DUF2512 family protein [Clostridium magnum]|uniref:DUF2512 family protein n=1 Tax=Clostridium magnum DSM 2767 TaxID=1121326 RepID=A0A162SRP3_9CLOT|nr:DUF2512 family protein [Clostridium magnum]KZL91780.1 hypothetical protein CLMAG_15820 [Clostridium magnum DSM 2767]SHJ67636.1 Protein of unknown function [Clostridium magnum DSM 2767]
MKHITALLIKFVMTAIVLEIVLYMLTELRFTSILYIAAAVTILAYIIGDLLILRATNNTVATIADVGLALATIYMFNFLWNATTISFTNALICAVVIGVGELFFHKYVSNNVLEKSKE